MDSIKIMKLRRFAMLLFALNTILLNVAANSYSIEFKNNRVLSEDTSDAFRNIISKPETLWGEVADIDIERLIAADTLYCQLENESVELIADYYGDDNNAQYHYIYYESSDKGIEAYVSVLDNYVHIDLRTPDDYYRIVSVSGNEVAIIRYEPQVLSEPEYGESSYDENPYEDNLNVASFSSRATPVIRVLFLYTSSALAMMSSPQQTAIKERAYLYINNGNQSFANSGINARLQLAYVGPTNYDESTHTWSETLSHFYGQSDGYMDEVHTLRNKYKADLCVLMTSKNNYCGEAKTINANANTAFCIIWPSSVYCDWRFSAIHEIGHLVGCRHNMSQDSSISPYIYGHGYINCVSGNAWSTIMSYESSCSLSNDRILYWSNPNVYYNGVATGTTTYENNSRVWNERAGTVSAFRNIDNTISYTSANNNTQALFESIEATTQITTSGGFEVQSGQMVEMRASTQICLLPNTHIKSGSTFRAITHTDNSSYPQFMKEKIVPPVNVDIDADNSARKILRDGQVLIERSGHTYTVMGALVN